MGESFVTGQQGEVEHEFGAVGVGAREMRMKKYGKNVYED
jgi:hypothetical protein